MTFRLTTWYYEARLKEVVTLLQVHEGGNINEMLYTLLVTVDSLNEYKTKNEGELEFYEKEVVRVCKEYHVVFPKGWKN